METRNYKKLELRDNNNTKTIIGNIPFMSDSLDLGGFIERISPTAFDQSLASSNEIYSLIEHDSGRVIGKRSKGTLVLNKTDAGLESITSPVDTNEVRDLIVNINGGMKDGISFGFSVMPDGDEWTQEGEQVVRTLNNINLYECSVVSMPAYPESSASTRAYEALDILGLPVTELRKALVKHKRNLKMNQTDWDLIELAQRELGMIYKPQDFNPFEILSKYKSII